MTCSVDGCVRGEYAKNYCDAHYRRARTNGGDPGSAEIAVIGRHDGCSFEGCIERHSARGLCNTHYAQFKRGKPLVAIAYRGNPQTARQISLKSRYGITSERYVAMLAEQGGRCAICKGESGQRAFHVDHDHACCSGGKSCGACVRALLCGRCNVGIGQFRESPELLRAAIAYLERP